MPDASAGLTADKVEAMVRRYLDGEPGVVMRPLAHGHGFLCRGGLGADDGAPWLFCVAADGGVLVRLPDDARARAIESGVGTENVALPDWVLAVATESGMDAQQIHGRPSDWVWVTLVDGESFERRRPYVHEALQYCRHARGKLSDAST